MLSRGANQYLILNSCFASLLTEKRLLGSKSSTCIIPPVVLLSNMTIGEAIPKLTARAFAASSHAGSLLTEHGQPRCIQQAGCFAACTTSCTGQGANACSTLDEIFAFYK